MSAVKADWHTGIAPLSSVGLYGSQSVCLPVSVGHTCVPWTTLVYLNKDRIAKISCWLHGNKNWLKFSRNSEWQTVVKTVTDPVDFVQQRNVKSFYSVMKNDMQYQAEF